MSADASFDKQQIIDRLRQVQDPELGEDLVTLNRVGNVAYCDGVAAVQVSTAARDPQVRQQLKQRVEEAVRSLGKPIQQVNVHVSASIPLTQAGGQKPSGQAPPQQQAQQQLSPQEQARQGNPLPGIKHIIAVGAGKGGVGKSTIAVNLAVGLGRAGYATGLLDGDIYGPSLPTMLGLDELQAQAVGNRILPFEVHGIKAMSLGSLVEEEKPLIWRGPMAHGAFRQLATQTHWEELDFLIIDLPPGTGDVPLTMAQLLPLSGAVVVCTPQKVAQDDARRAVHMFEQLGIDMLGIVENMSYFIGDDQKEYDIFGRGGAELMAQQMGVPFLGTIPINTRLRRNSDTGNPTDNYSAADPLTQELEAMVQRLVDQVNVRAMQGGAERPTLDIR